MPEKAEILVVEDCRMSALLLRYIVQESGLASDTASSGPEACEKINAGSYRLIFLDIQLPGFDGIEVARRTRESAAVEQPELVFLTGMGETLDPDELASVRPKAVHFKPVAPSAIRKVLTETFPS